MRTKKALTITLMLLAIYLALRIFLKPLGQDEGVFLTIGQGIVKGFLPYKDFFDHKPPGIYFLIAALYRFFSNNILGYKFVLLLAQLASAGLVWIITRELKHRKTEEPVKSKYQIPNIKAGINKHHRSCHSGLEPESRNHVSVSESSRQNTSNSKIDIVRGGTTRTIPISKDSDFATPKFDSLPLWAPIFFLFLTIIFEGERFIAEPFVSLCLLISFYLYCHCEIRGFVNRSNLTVRLPRLSFHSKARNDKADGSISRVKAASWSLPRVLLRGGLTSLLLTGLFLSLALLLKQTAILSILAFYLFLIIRKEWKTLLPISIGLIVPIGVALIYLSANNLLPDAYRQIIAYNFKFYPNEPILKVLWQLSPYFLYTLPVWILFIVQAKRKLWPLSSRRTSSNNNTIRAIEGYGSRFLTACCSLFSSRHASSNNNSIRAVRDYGSKRFTENCPHFSSRHTDSNNVDSLWTNSLVICGLAILPMLAYFGRHYPHYWLQSIPFAAIAAAYCSSSFSLGKHTKVWALGSRGGQALACWIILLTLALTYQFVKVNYPRYKDEQKITSYLRTKNQCIYTENQFVPQYFLADREPLSKYLYVTEITESSENSEQISLQKLKESNCLVVWPSDLNYAYAKELQSYIASNYRPIFWTRSLGTVVYERNF